MKRGILYTTTCTIFLLVLTLQLVAADIRLTLLTPQAQFEGQIGQPIEYYIGVSNKNNFTVTVTLGDASAGSLDYKSPNQFELNPGDTKETKYTFTPDTAGTYSVNIPVNFKGNGESFSLQQTLKLSIKDASGTVPENVQAPDSGSGSSGSTDTKPLDNNQTTKDDKIDKSVFALDIGPAIPDSGPTPSDDSDESDGNGSNSKLWLYIGGSLFIIAIIVIVYFYIKSKKKPDYVEDFEELNQTVEQE